MFQIDLAADVSGEKSVLLNGVRVEFQLAHVLLIVRIQGVQHVRVKRTVLPDNLLEVQAFQVVPSNVSGFVGRAVQQSFGWRRRRQLVHLPRVFLLEVLFCSLGPRDLFLLPLSVLATQLQHLVVVVRLGFGRLLRGLAFDDVQKLLLFDTLFDVEHSKLLFIAVADGRFRGFCGNGLAELDTGGFACVCRFEHR